MKAPKPTEPRPAEIQIAQMLYIILRNQETMMAALANLISHPNTSDGLYQSLALGANATKEVCDAIAGAPPSALPPEPDSEKPN